MNRLNYFSPKIQRFFQDINSFPYDRSHTNFQILRQIGQNSRLSKKFRFICKNNIGIYDKRKWKLSLSSCIGTSSNYEKSIFNSQKLKGIVSHFNKIVYRIERFKPQFNKKYDLIHRDFMMNPLNAHINGVFRGSYHFHRPLIKEDPRLRYSFSKFKGGTSVIFSYASERLEVLQNDHIFFEKSFDKSRLKKFVRWFVNKWGLKKTIKLLDTLKFLGFKYAKASGVSLNLEDLYVPSHKDSLVKINQFQLLEQEFKVFLKNSEQTTYSLKFISTWTLINELLRNSFLQYFKNRINSSPYSSSANKLINNSDLTSTQRDKKFLTQSGSDSLYIMAFSGARGNMSQVSQLTLMRGLMSDPLGKLVEFPIISNFREGLNLTEYLISCYGARKGIIDTGLRTATAGDFTRRLVDVAHSVIIQKFDCGTQNGIYLKDLILSKNKKILFPLKQRLIGRIIANNSRISKLSRNKEISLTKLDYYFKFSHNSSSPKDNNNSINLSFLSARKTEDHWLYNEGFYSSFSKKPNYLLKKNFLSNNKLRLRPAHYNNESRGSVISLFVKEADIKKFNYSILWFFFKSFFIRASLKEAGGARGIKGASVNEFRKLNSMNRTLKNKLLVFPMQEGRLVQNFLNKNLAILEKNIARFATLNFFIKNHYKFFWILPRYSLEQKTNFLITPKLNLFFSRYLYSVYSSSFSIRSNLKNSNFLEPKESNLHRHPYSWSFQNKKYACASFITKPVITRLRSFNQTFSKKINSCSLKLNITGYKMEFVDSYALPYSFENDIMCRSSIDYVIPNEKKKQVGFDSTQEKYTSEEIAVRSPLTCETSPAPYLCRKCYGWNAIGRIIDIGEAVGILAAQSLGEPGTQLTLRTFHTGGIYSEKMGDFKLIAPFDGNLVLPNYCTIKKYFNTKEKISTFVTSRNFNEGFFNEEYILSSDTQQQPLFVQAEGKKVPLKTTFLSRCANFWSKFSCSFYSNTLASPYLTLFQLFEQRKSLSQELIASKSRITKEWSKSSKGKSFFFPMRDLIYRPTFEITFLNSLVVPPTSEQPKVELEKQKFMVNFDNLTKHHNFKYANLKPEKQNIKFHAPKLLDYQLFQSSFSKPHLRSNRILPWPIHCISPAKFNLKKRPYKKLTLASPLIKNCRYKCYGIPTNIYSRSFQFVSNETNKYYRRKYPKLLLKLSYTKTKTFLLTRLKFLCPGLFFEKTLSIIQTFPVLFYLNTFYLSPVSFLCPIFPIFKRYDLFERFKNKSSVTRSVIRIGIRFVKFYSQSLQRSRKVFSAIPSSYIQKPRSLSRDNSNDQRSFEPKVEKMITPALFLKNPEQNKTFKEETKDFISSYPVNKTMRSLPSHKVNNKRKMINKKTQRQNFFRKTQLEKNRKKNAFKNILKGLLKRGRGENIDWSQQKNKQSTQFFENLLINNISKFPFFSSNYFRKSIKKSQYLLNISNFYSSLFIKLIKQEFCVNFSEFSSITRNLYHPLSSNNFPQVSLMKKISLMPSQKFFQPDFSYVKSKNILAFPFYKNMKSNSTRLRNLKISTEYKNSTINSYSRAWEIPLLNSNRSHTGETIKSREKLKFLDFQTARLSAEQLKDERNKGLSNVKGKTKSTDKDSSVVKNFPAFEYGQNTAQFIFSQFFVSDFFEISSQLYIKNLRIFNFKSETGNILNNLLDSLRPQNTKNLFEKEKYTHDTSLDTNKGYQTRVPSSYIQQSSIIRAGGVNNIPVSSKKENYETENLTTDFTRKNLKFTSGLKENEIENFARLRSHNQNKDTQIEKLYDGLQSYQTTFTLISEGKFKKNRVMVEINKKPNILIQVKKDSFLFTVPLSYQKNAINKEIPYILPPTNFTKISNFFSQLNMRKYKKSCLRFFKPSISFNISSLASLQKNKIARSRLLYFKRSKYYQKPFILNSLSLPGSFINSPSFLIVPQFFFSFVQKKQAHNFIDDVFMTDPLNAHINGAFRGSYFPISFEALYKRFYKARVLSNSQLESTSKEKMEKLIRWKKIFSFYSSFFPRPNWLFYKGFLKRGWKKKFFFKENANVIDFCRLNSMDRTSRNTGKIISKTSFRDFFFEIVFYKGLFKRGREKTMNRERNFSLPVKKNKWHGVFFDEKTSRPIKNKRSSACTIHLTDFFSTGLIGFFNKKSLFFKESLIKNSTLAPSIHRFLPASLKEALIKNDLKKKSRLHIFGKEKPFSYLKKISSQKSLSLKKNITSLQSFTKKKNHLRSYRLKIGTTNFQILWYSFISAGSSQFSKYIPTKNSMDFQSIKLCQLKFSTTTEKKMYWKLMNRTKNKLLDLFYLSFNYPGLFIDFSGRKSVMLTSPMTDSLNAHINGAFRGSYQNFSKNRLKRSQGNDFKKGSNKILRLRFIKKIGTNKNDQLQNFWVNSFQTTSNDIINRQGIINENLIPWSRKLKILIPVPVKISDNCATKPNKLFSVRQILKKHQEFTFTQNTPICQLDRDSSSNISILFRFQSLSSCDIKNKSSLALSTTDPLNAHINGAFRGSYRFSSAYSLYFACEIQSFKEAPIKNDHAHKFLDRLKSIRNLFAPLTKNENSRFYRAFKKTSFAFCCTFWSQLEIGLETSTPLGYPIIKKRNIEDYKKIYSYVIHSQPSFIHDTPLDTHKWNRIRVPTSYIHNLRSIMVPFSTYINDIEPGYLRRVSNDKKSFKPKNNLSRKLERAMQLIVYNMTKEYYRMFLNLFLKSENVKFFKEAQVKDFFKEKKFSFTAPISIHINRINSEGLRFLSKKGITQENSFKLHIMNNQNIRHHKTKRFANRKERPKFHQMNLSVISYKLFPFSIMNQKQARPLQKRSNLIANEILVTLPLKNKRLHFLENNAHLILSKKNSVISNKSIKRDASIFNSVIPVNNWHDSVYKNYNFLPILNSSTIFGEFFKVADGMILQSTSYLFNEHSNLFHLSSLSLISKFFNSKSCKQIVNYNLLKSNLITIQNQFQLKKAYLSIHNFANRPKLSLETYFPKAGFAFHFFSNSTNFIKKTDSKIYQKNLFYNMSCYNNHLKEFMNSDLISKNQKNQISNNTPSLSDAVRKTTFAPLKNNNSKFYIPKQEEKLHLHHPLAQNNNWNCGITIDRIYILLFRYLSEIKYSSLLTPSYSIRKKYRERCHRFHFILSYRANTVKKFQHNSNDKYIKGRRKRSSYTGVETTKSVEKPYFTNLVSQTPGRYDVEGKTFLISEFYLEPFFLHEYFQNTESHLRPNRLFFKIDFRRRKSMNRTTFAYPFKKRPSRGVQASLWSFQHKGNDVPGSDFSSTSEVALKKQLIKPKIVEEKLLLFSDIQQNKYKKFFNLRYNWQFLSFKFDLIIAKNLTNLRNGKYDNLAYLKKKSLYLIAQIENLFASPDLKSPAVKFCSGSNSTDYTLASSRKKKLMEHHNSKNFLETNQNEFSENIIPLINNESNHVTKYNYLSSQPKVAVLHSYLNKKKNKFYDRAMQLESAYSHRRQKKYTLAPSKLIKNSLKSKNFEINLFETINLQTINFDSFQSSTFNQIYFFNSVASLTNSGKSSDITQGVPLLKRYFDLPKDSPLHLALKQTFQKYSYYGQSKFLSSFENIPEIQDPKFHETRKNFSLNFRTPPALSDLTGFFNDKSFFKNPLIKKSQLDNYVKKETTLALPNKSEIFQSFFKSRLKNEWNSFSYTESKNNDKKLKYAAFKKPKNSWSFQRRRDNLLNEVVSSASKRPGVFDKFSPLNNRNERGSKLRTIILNYSLVKILQKIVNNVQAVYRAQGVEIYDQHIEVLVSQMGSKIRIKEDFDSKFFWNEIVPLNLIKNTSDIEFEPIISGITKISLQTDSFISAASFQSSSKILSQESLKKSKDFIFGLKESIIVSELIPSGTGIFISS